MRNPKNLGVFQLTEHDQTLMDGTDDTAAFQSAIDHIAGHDTINIVHIPDGTVNLTGQVVLRGDTNGQITVRGNGIDRTRIDSTGARVFDTDTIDTLVIEDLTIDCAQTGATFRIGAAGKVRSLVVRRCRFVNYRNGIQITDVDDATIENNVFDGGYGRYQQYHAVRASGQTGKLEIVGNTFTGVWGTLLAGENANENGTITELVYRDNYADGGFWGAPATQTVTVTGITDDRTYSVTPAPTVAPATTGSTVIWLNVVASGTTTGTASYGEIVDSAASFDTITPLTRGDLVKTGDGKTGFVTAAIAAGKLGVESWFDTVTGNPTGPPQTGTSYEICHIVHGFYVSSPGGDVRLRTFVDLDGTPTVPPVGATLQFVEGTTFGIQVLQSVHSGRVHGNTFRRFWGDQIAWQSDNGHVYGNDIEDGFDVGVTIWGDHSTVANNNIRRQGGSGIFGAETIRNYLITGNNIWLPTRDRLTGQVGGISVGIGGDGTISNNRIDGTGPTSRYGIAIRNGSARNHIVGNKIGRMAVAAFVFENAAGIHQIESNDIGSGVVPLVEIGNSASFLYDQAGDGDPTAGGGWTRAVPGSVWRRLDGGAGSSLYVKETGTGQAGWTAK